MRKDYALLKKFFGTVVISSLSATMLLPNATAFAQPTEEISSEQQAAFEQYKFYDDIYQQQPFKDVEIGDKDFDRHNSSFRTTNPNPTSDDSIGAIYLYYNNTKLYEAQCTASHLGGKWWHCIRGKENEKGAILQSDGEFAGIENIYFKGRDYDIALIKVGTGISTPQAFSLAPTKPEIGSKMEVIGFSGRGDRQHEFSSKSQVEILGRQGFWQDRDRIYQYYDLTNGLTLDYASCSGDSGGPLYAGRTIYGVVTGGPETGENVFYNCGDITRFTNVDSHIPWIQETMRAHNSTSFGERVRAFQGGFSVRHYRGCDVAKPLRNPAFGSSSSDPSSEAKCDRKKK
ncbi:MAG: trypsin-like serine protease [Corynebacterium sp.]|uniref:trypsin-like serine protease n=1 Tax=Corynebacterium sp. TaxID=1720 RepID=UPI0026DA8A69|nr:trypsin-like serine protease [Corynebacterium sp.]MDO4761863.1 trypsin-like serine protease [Corynebacterium sp.]